MKHRVIGAIMAMAAAVALVSLVPVRAAGQASAAGSRNLPRLPDGHPDMQGFWASDAAGAAHSIEVGRDPAADVIQGREEGDRNPRVLVDPPDEKIPYQPAAAAKRRQLLIDNFTPTKREHIDPHIRALLDGAVRNNYVPGELQILQPPGYVEILYSSNHAYRLIPTDGRPHLGENIKLWMGDSRGRWEGNTLVVEVTNNNNETWFDAHGSFHSDALHVVERWTMVSADRINYEATVEDPKMFTKPMKIALTIDRFKQQGYELWEDTRHEGERDTERMLVAGRRDKAAGIKGIHEHRRLGR